MDERTAAGLELARIVDNTHRLKTLDGQSAALREHQRDVAKLVATGGDLVVVSRRTLDVMCRKDIAPGTVVLCRGFFIHFKDDGSVYVTDDENNRLPGASLPQFILDFCQ